MLAQSTPEAGEMNLARDWAQEWLGTITSKPNLELSADTSWPSMGLGANVPIPNLELDVDMLWSKLGLGNKKDIGPFWIVTSCDDFLNRVDS
jgi:hypothetical protein